MKECSHAVSSYVACRKAKLMSSQAYYAHQKSEEGREAARALDAVPKFELYKALREEELLLYRSAVRVFAMHNGPLASLPKQQQRLLEDLRDMIGISNDRHEVEVASAATDHTVLLVHQSGVANERKSFFDGVNDVPLEDVLPEDDVEDDSGVVFTSLSQQRQSAGNGRPTAPMHRRGQKAPPSKSRPVKEESKHAAEVALIDAEVRSLARRFVASTGADRAELKSALLSKRQQLGDLRVLVAAEGSTSTAV